MSHQWASWCLESLAPQLFIQLCVQANNKETSKFCITGPLWGPVNGGFPSQRTSDTKQFPCHDEIMWLLQSVNSGSHFPPIYVLPSMSKQLYNHRDHYGYGLIQWQMTLHCNIISHWLRPYPEWSQNHSQQFISCIYLQYHYDSVHCMRGIFLSSVHMYCLFSYPWLSQAPSQYKDRLIYVWRFPC